jgi:hypothetical protein
MKYVVGVRPPQPPKARDGSIFQEALNAKYKGEDPTPIIAQMSPKKRGIATLLLMKANPFTDIVSLDQPYDVDLGFDVPVKIIPDLLTGVEIVENKFTSGYYNPESVKSEPQALLYYVGIKALTGSKKKVYYQLFNTVSKDVTMVEITPDSEQIDGLFDWIETQFNGIDKCMRTDIWDHGNHRQCDFPTTCPLMMAYGV